MVYIYAMKWIKFEDQKPPENKEVLVKFGNGKRIKGIRNGVWMTYPPDELDAQTMLSGEREWTHLSPFLLA